MSLNYWVSNFLMPRTIKYDDIWELGNIKEKYQMNLNFFLSNFSWTPFVAPILKTPVSMDL